MRRPALCVLGAVGLGVVLSGCSGAFTRDPPPPACPRASILGEANRMTRFRDGPGRDITDVLYEAELTDIDAPCKYDRKKKRVTIDLRLFAVATRGPNDESKAAAVDYFVAILDPSRNVLAREPFTLNLVYPAGLAKVGREDELEQVEIPLGSIGDGPNYEVIVGLRLTPEQMSYNRAQRGR